MAHIHRQFNIVDDIHKFHLYERYPSLLQHCTLHAVHCTPAVPMYRVVDPHWFNANPDTDPAFFLIADPDPVPYPGFWWPKIGNNLQLEIFKYIFTMNWNFLIPRPPKRTPKLQEKPSTSKENVQHFKTWKFLIFFYFFVVNFAILDPDPELATQINAGPRGSRSGCDLRIRIHNPAYLACFETRISKKKVGMHVNFYAKK